MTRTPWLAGVLAAGALALAACGGDEASSVALSPASASRRRRRLVRARTTRRCTARPEGEVEVVATG